MKKYCLKVTSKNEKSLKKFLYIFFKHLKTKLNIIQKPIALHSKRKVITLLKSPHVNKTAQEHFEARTFSRKILVVSSCFERDLIFLKKVLSELFHDVSIHLELVTNKIVTMKNKESLLYPTNFKLWTNNSIQTNSKRYKKKAFSQKLSLKEHSLFDTTKFLSLISIFGEVSIMTSVQQQ